MNESKVLRRAHEQAETELPDRMGRVREFLSRPSVRVGIGVLGNALVTGAMMSIFRNRKPRARETVGGAFFRKAAARFR
ncbi:MAG: hypothetical protein ACYC7A_03570 [Thermoanaerobaculia bacterium]